MSTHFPLFFPKIQYSSTHVPNPRRVLARVYSRVYSFGLYSLDALIDGDWEDCSLVQRMRVELLEGTVEWIDRVGILGVTDSADGDVAAAGEDGEREPGV